jgi:hypothetical protein
LHAGSLHSFIIALDILQLLHDEFLHFDKLLIEFSYILLLLSNQFFMITQLLLQSFDAIVFFEFTLGDTLYATLLAF